MSDSPRDQELARLAEELSTTLSSLQDELETERDPPRGPFGLPRPPTPRELLDFTDEFAIPTAIAVLEANIRLLEALQGVIRLARTGQEVGERGRETRARTEELSRGALDRLDDVLVDLQDALSGRPENPEARTLLDDARTLRGEIDDRLSEADQHSNERDDQRFERERRPPEGNGESSSARDSDEKGVTVDVDAELDSIRDAVEDNEDGEDDGGIS